MARFEAVLALGSALGSAIVVVASRLKRTQLLVPAMATLAIGAVTAFRSPDYLRRVYWHATPLFVREGTTTSRPP